MTSRTLLKYLLNIHILLGVHRNYCTRSQIQKYFIILHVFVSLSAHTFVVFEEMYLAWMRATPGVVIYCVFAISAYAILAPCYLTAIYKSPTFVSFLENIDRVADCLKDDRKTVKPINVTYWFTVILTIVTVACAILKTLDFMIVVANYGSAFVFFMLLSQIVLRTTIAFQYIIFFVAITVVVKYMKRLTDLITRVQKSVQCNDMDLDDKSIINKENIHKWAQMYLDLANSCEKVSICFGRQYFYSLYLFLCYYIMFVYQACCVRPNMDEIDYKQVLLLILNYTVALIMPLIGGQMAANQGTKVRRAVTRFYNTIVVPDSFESEAKSTKDFIRLIKRHPMQIKMLSNVPTEMYILPVILSLAVNYLIILLQYNHVI